MPMLRLERVSENILFVKTDTRSNLNLIIIPQSLTPNNEVGLRKNQLQ